MTGDATGLRLDQAAAQLLPEFSRTRLQQWIRDGQLIIRVRRHGKHHIAVEAVSAYWHFVDIVWIFLFSTLYFLK